MSLSRLPLYRAVSIDFNRMRVRGKSLRMRRLDDGNTEWNWYCTLGRKWKKYGDEVDGIAPLNLSFWVLKVPTFSVNLKCDLAKILTMFLFFFIF